MRTSLAPLSPADGKLLEKLLREQARTRKVYPLDAAEKRAVQENRVRREGGEILVSVPDDAETATPADASTLPLNYDSTTLQTIERIDVLWLKGRSMARAFEIEHTTAIYSGILRMADLLALQPNMDIRLHIVAPDARKEKVFDEIKRPVFSMLEGKPLRERCTFLSYDSIRQIGGLPHLAHLSDSVLAEYEESAMER